MDIIKKQNKERRQKRPMKGTKVISQKEKNKKHQYACE